LEELKKLFGEEKKARQIAEALWLERGYRNFVENGVSLNARFAPIVLKKSFLAEQRKFLGPLMRFVRGDVRDHIDSPKIDHGLLYRRCRALQRQRYLKIDFREIFGVARFSTFATVSARSGRPRMFPNYRLPLSLLPSDGFGLITTPLSCNNCLIPGPESLLFGTCTKM
jgi:hypothetical protein